VASLETSITAYDTRLSASESATEIALDQVKSRAEQELTELASALQRVMQLWSSDAQTEISSLRDETAMALANMRVSTSATSAKVVEVANELGESIEKLAAETEVKQVLQEMVDLVADEEGDNLMLQLQENIREEQEARISLADRVEYSTAASHATHHAMQVASVMEEMIVQVENHALHENIKSISKECKKANDGVARGAEIRIALQADVQRAELAVSELQATSEVALALESLISSVIQQATNDTIERHQIEGGRARSQVMETISEIRSELKESQIENQDFQTRNKMQILALQGAKDPSTIEWERTTAYVEASAQQLGGNSANLILEQYPSDILNVRGGVFG